MGRTLVSVVASSASIPSLVPSKRVITLEFKCEQM